MTDSNSSDNDEYVDFVAYLDHKGKMLIDKWHEFGSISDIQNEFNEFVISTHATVEQLSSLLITEYVIDSRFSDLAHSYVDDGMSQSHRERLLQECNIFGGDIIGKLSEFRSLRNKIAHEPFAKIDWLKNDVENKINTILDVLKKLANALSDESIIKQAVESDGI